MKNYMQYTLNLGAPIMKQAVEKKHLGRPFTWMMTEAMQGDLPKRFATQLRSVVANHQYFRLSSSISQ